MEGMLVGSWSECCLLGLLGWLLVGCQVREEYVHSVACVYYMYIVAFSKKIWGFT